MKRLSKKYKNVDEYLNSLTNDTNSRNILNENNSSEDKTDYSYLYPKIYQIINDNLNNILPLINFPKEPSGIYKYSYTRNNNDDDLPLINYIINNINIFIPIQNEFYIQLSDIDWNDLLYKYRTEYSQHILIKQKIQKYLQELNNKIKNQRAEYLLSLPNRVGYSVEINWDPTDEHERTLPILVVEIITKDRQKKDVVCFGFPGDLHSDIVENDYYGQLDERLPNLDLSKMHQGYAFYINKIAFIDKPINTTKEYSEDELKQILKNDPKIDKVFNLPKSVPGNIIQIGRLH